MTDAALDAELTEIAAKIADVDANGSKIGELQARLFRLRSEKAFRRSKEGPMGPADEISQAERRKVLENDRKVRATYFQHAQSDPELELGGRFVKLTPTSVTASGQSAIPQQPEGSPWRCDPVADEPPLGWSVEDHDAVGERHERAGSAVPVEPTNRIAVAATATLEPRAGVVAAKPRRRRM